MTVRTWLFDGIADTTVATTTNTKSVDNVAASTVSPGTGGTWLYSTTNPQDGSSCIAYTPASGGTGLVRLPFVASATSGRFSVPMNIPTIPTGTVSETYVGARRTGGYAFQCRVDYTGGTTAKLTVLDNAGAVIGTTTGTVPAGSTAYARFSVVFNTGTSTTDGSVTVNVYNGKGTAATATLTLTGVNLGSGILVSAIDVGRLNTSTITQALRFDSIQMDDGVTSSELPAYVYTAPVNVGPTITAGATVTMISGTTASVGFVADDSDGTVSSFQTPTVISSADTPPIVGSPTYSGLGTAHATATYPVTGLTPSDTTISAKAVDNLGAASATAASQRIIYTSTNPKAKAVTLVGATMTSPGSGTPKDAWNAWLANPYDAATNPGGVQPPQFTTAAPPSASATVTVDYQPLDAASLPPTFSQSWALTPDAAVPVTIYVDLRFSGVTKATATTTLSSTTAVPVGRTCTDTENTAIGSGQLSRVAPSVVARFS